MAQYIPYIPKPAVVAEIKRYKHKADERLKIKGRTLAEDWKDSALQNLCGNLLHFLDTLEAKEVDLIIHTIIAECCNWLARCSDLSHDEIEELRNLMLTIKDEQLKAQEGE